MEMDIDEPGDTIVIKHAIGYAASMGMGLLSEIDALHTNVSPFVLIQLCYGADNSCIVDYVLYEGAGVVCGGEEVLTEDQSPDGERSLTLGGGKPSGTTVGRSGSQDWSSQGSG